MNDGIVYNATLTKKNQTEYFKPSFIWNISVYMESLVCDD